MEEKQGKEKMRIEMKAQTLEASPETSLGERSGEAIEKIAVGTRLVIDGAVCLAKVLQIVKKEFTPLLRKDR